MNSKNSKTNELHRFALNLSQSLDLRSSDKHVALQNSCTYYTWKNLRKQFKNNKLKIIAPTWNDEFDVYQMFTRCFLFVSDIQDCIEFITKKHETLTTIPRIDVCTNRINNRLMFKMKDGYKLAL